VSYVGHHPLGGLTPVGVGSRAASDPLLAKASLDASTIMMEMSKVDPARRFGVMERLVERYGANPADVVVEMKRGFADNVNPDQAAFDAMRIAIANARLDRGLESLSLSVASRSGWDSLVDTGLGNLSSNDRATGCMIAGGAQTVGGIASLVPGYGTLIGGIIGIGSGIAGGQLDCGKESRDAAAAAAQAQAQLLAAQQTAAATAASAAAASRSNRIKTIAGGGAILLAVLGAAWLILD
jgi:hypothetical protein